MGATVRPVLRGLEPRYEGRIVALSDYRIIAPLAYQGKADCENVTCTRFYDHARGSLGRCMGWHCSYCDAPCGSQGHNCDAAKTLIAAAQREAHNTGKEPA